MTLESPLSSALIGGRRFFTKAEVSEDQRTLHKKGGREGDVFYRDRWSHDKVVRSTHGVNCTGSPYCCFAARNMSRRTPRT